MTFRLKFEILLQRAREQLDGAQPLVEKFWGLAWQGVQWVYELVRQVTKQAIGNQISSSASEMAFNGMLSLFPILLLVVAAIGRLATSRPVLTLMVTTLQQVVPGDVASVLNRGLEELADGADRQVFSIGIVTLLWVASAFLAPVIRALNNSYGVPLHRRRPWWLNRLLAVGIFIGTMGLLLSASFLVLIGRSVLDWGASQAGWSQLLVGWGQLSIWPLSMGSIVLALAFIYRLGPSQQPALAPVWPGAIAGGAIWLVVSSFFRIYVRNFGRYEAIYGSIGGAIVLLLWLYLSAFGILLGAEVNAAIHILRLRHREQKRQAEQTEQSLLPAERPRLSLPSHGESSPPPAEPPARSPDRPQA